MRHRSPFGLANGAFLISALLFLSSAVSARPFQSTSQNPFSVSAGLPLPTEAALLSDGEFDLDIGLEITNTLNTESIGAENLLLDFEAYHLKLIGRYAMKDWQFQVYLPMIYRGGGEFDKAIDDWHRFFQLPRADRPNVAHNRFDLQYSVGGTPVIDIDQSGHQLGDLQLSVGREVFRSKSQTFSLWLSADLPTGDTAFLTGNDATDISLYLAHANQLTPEVSFFTNLGAILPGDSAVSTLDESSTVWFGLFGIDARVSRMIELQVQVNAHSAIYDNSALRLLGESVELLFGGSVHIDRCTALDIVFSEDIKVGAAPDISLMLGWHQRFDCR